MEKKVVSAEENKILKKMFWNSHLVFANFNMTKMEANGFTMTMAPAVEEYLWRRYRRQEGRLCPPSVLLQYPRSRIQLYRRSVLRIGEGLPRR